MVRNKMPRPMPQLPSIIKSQNKRKKELAAYPNIKPRIKPITKPIPSGSIPNSRIAS